MTQKFNLNKIQHLPRTPRRKVLDKTLKRLQTYKWYRQGGAVKPFYVSYPWQACLGFTLRRKKLPFYFKDLLVYQKSEFMVDFFRKDLLKKVALFYFLKQKKNPKFIFELFTNWRKRYIQPYFRIIHYLEKIDFKSLDEKDLIKNFKKFSDIYTNEWREAIFIDGFDFYGDYLLEKELEKSRIQISSADFRTLLSSENPSWVQKEQIDLAKIQKKINRNKKLKTTLLKRKSLSTLKIISKEFFKDLEEHSQKYHWLHNDYAAITTLTPAYFSKNVRELISNKKKLEEIYGIEKNLKKIEKDKQIIIERLKIPPHLKNIFEFFVTLSQWREHRKSYNQMANRVLKKFAEEFSQRTKLSMNVVEYLFWWELLNIFKIKNQQIEIAKKRRKGAFYFSFNGIPRISYFGKKGRDLLKFFNQLVLQKQELSGQPAFHGTVKGKVRLILTKKDFYKMRKGDIIIAPNTRPEYLPIMKIASAIVAEEGGLTCHAAIVSRELKIPCVVGMQGATEILKDGDMVEVDANKGIVKIIKRK